jgi:ATP-dependent DNA helicase RecG
VSPVSSWASSERLADVSELDQPLARRIGAKTAAALEKHLDIMTVGQLLRHYPRRYAERGALTDLASLPLDEHVTVIAQVMTVKGRRMQQRPGWILEVAVGDGRRSLKLTYFHKNAGLHRKREETLAVGTVALFSGKVGVYRGDLQLVNPEYHVLAPAGRLGAPVLVDGGQVDAAVEEAMALADKPIPIYPAAAAIQSWEIAKAVQVLVRSVGDVPDPLPSDVRQQEGLIDLTHALLQVHDPATMAEARQARRRLRFEEAFVLQAALLRRRASAAAEPAVPRAAVSGGLLAAFDERLPFALTTGQREVGDQVAADLAQPHPMHRLLQGEVGSGKTVVALRAMLAVVDAGGQAALLAPTEVLAVQHFRSIVAMMGDLAEGGMLGGSDIGTQVTLLTGSQPAAVRRRALLQAASGEAGIVVGTHALLSEQVQFADLGLVVVDEQHRFGVEQRDALRAKSDSPPHLLVMTATPIPRTVAMTVFGDLETSTLTELPSGRQPVQTHVVPADRADWVSRVWQRVREEVDAGHQAFVVCPRIGDDASEGGGDGGGDEGDLLDDAPELDEAQTKRPAVGVLQVVELLRQEPALAGTRIELLHGRLPVDESERVMRGFAAGDVDVLVATTVVEVGVDVPNATAMVVLDADRFGISQLHQLRGRIGRGSAAGVALLVSGMPQGTPAWERLTAVASTSDGFELARVDLEQRREGDVLGAAQSGVRSSLRLLRVLHDEDVILAAREAAAGVVENDPTLAEHPALSHAIDALVGSEREEYLQRG